MSGRYRVTVVDDHSLFAETLAIALRRAGMESRAIVPDPDVPPGQLLKSIVQTRPDLVLMDLHLGAVGEANQLVSQLAASRLSVAVVTGSSDAATQGSALASGAVTVIPKSASFQVVTDTVCRMCAGLTVLSGDRRTQLLSAYQRSISARRELRQSFEQLTRREAEVLGLLMAGKQVHDIACIRFVSESTVRSQVKSILAKLQVNSQLAAVGLAHEIGWLPPNDPGAVYGTAAGL